MTEREYEDDRRRGGRREKSERMEREDRRRDDRRVRSEIMDGESRKRYDDREKSEREDDRKGTNLRKREQDRRRGGEEESRRPPTERIGSVVTTSNGVDAADIPYRGDVNDQFIWKKKDEKLKKMGIDPYLDPQAREGKRRELQAELQKAKLRRLDREQERADWEEEQARVAREKEAEENADWEYREELFHATNFYMKQAVRFREHRPTPADYLARNLRLDLTDVAADPKPPYENIGKVNVDRLREIVDHIEEEIRFLPLFPIECEGLKGEKFGEALRDEYWSCLRVIATATLQKLERGANATNGVHQSVENDVEQLLEGIDCTQLDKMQREVQETLRVGGDIDEEYWETLLKRIEYHRARARLDEISKALVEYKESHKHASVPEDGSEEVAEAQDDEEMLRKEARKGLGADEEKFTEEVNVDRAYNWNDKYKPRKPKYFNRVHTGYEWNKYNQTHYDHDNPPPKTVQGYKFNVFYPDLIEKSQAPTFKIEKTDNPDVCIIRFIAGPPYEDIAFKIVNREWEHSHKKGFRCTFERGILHLWVNFKRMRYRR